MRGLCRSSGSDLVLAARPGWTHSVALKVSVVPGVGIYAIAASRKGVLVRHMACSVDQSGKVALARQEAEVEDTRRGCLRLQRGPAACRLSRLPDHAYRPPRSGEGDRNRLEPALRRLRKRVLRAGARLVITGRRMTLALSGSRIAPRSIPADPRYCRAETPSANALGVLIFHDSATPFCPFSNAHFRTDN